MYWYLKCLRQYADFKGRACPKEHVMFSVVHYTIIFTIFFSILFVERSSTGGEWDLSRGGKVLLTWGILYYVATAIPEASVTVRRLHDTGLSGWKYFNPLRRRWMLKELSAPSDEGVNKYGPKPQQHPPR